MATKLAGTKYTLSDDFSVNRSVVSVGASAGEYSAATFGILQSNTAAQNAAALMAFNTAARAISDAGGIVALRIPPGTYVYDGGAAKFWLSGIKKLRIIGHGATIENVYSGSPDFLAQVPLPNPVNSSLYSGYGKTINTTAVGGTTITLKTPSEHTVCVPGEYVMVASLDIQYNGFPPNCDQFEFAKVVSKNTGTGVITLDRPLRYAHRDDFPDAVAGENTSGKARVWRLNTSSGDLLAPLFETTWDIEHVYEGLTVLATAGIDYLVASGRKVTFIDCTLPGVVPAIAELVSFIRGTLTKESEPDKLVSQVTFEDVMIEGAMPFQSSSIDVVQFRGGSIRGKLTLGTAKNVYASGTDIGEIAVGPGTTFCGRQRVATLDNCNVRKHENSDLPAGPGAAAVTVDGTNCAYANGVFTVLKSSSEFAKWAVVPGTSINFRRDAYYTGDAGTAVVTKLTDTSTHLLVETTCRSAAVPAWSDSTVIIQRSGVLQFSNCRGSEIAQQGSFAASKGRRFGELWRYRWAGKHTRSGYWYGIVGRLVSVRWNVRQVIAANYITIIDYASWDPTNMSTAARVFEWRIDLGVAGEGRIDAAGITGVGLGPNGHFKLATVDQTTMPAVWWNGGAVNWEVSHVPSAVDVYTLPVFDIEFEFDRGSFFDPIPAAADRDGNTYTSVVGLTL
jgi:hypothetical protein